MKSKTLVIGLVVAIPMVVSTWAKAENNQGQSEVIVAIIDSGLRATHQEFQYEGKDSTTDQIVAWYDFSAQIEGQPSVPAPGQVWDQRVEDPFDHQGHGTAVASAVAGLNKTYSKDKSFCPGCKLAIAKVSQPGEEPLGASITGDISAAIDWAVDTVHADVINISIGLLAPFPAFLEDIDESLASARDRGVLVIVANGNGWGNDGLIPGEPPLISSMSPALTLSVGASQIATGATNHIDPEVVATFSQVLASNARDTAYGVASGASFASPLVAGMAAKLMEITIASGKNSSPDYIETLLKYSAIDTAAPPMWEGYGVLNESSFPPAYLYAWMGALPQRPFPDPSGLYVEQYANRVRSPLGQ